MTEPHSPDSKKVKPSRRDFLIDSGVLGFGFLLKQLLPNINLRSEPVKKETEPFTVAEIPATIMFHARENQKRILPELIEYLKEQGYTFVTYKGWYESLRNNQVIEKPVILTFDDITFVKGSSNFRFYSEIVEMLFEEGVPAVFGVVTEPVFVGADEKAVQLTDQDQSAWDTAKLWVESGNIELATHTESHPNLNNPTLDDEDHRREIVESANLIERYTGQQVTTLILPFGNGITMEGEITPRVLNACDDSAIRFVVGIAGMREPIPTVTEDGQIIYGVGRIMPDDTQPDDILLTSLQRQVDDWTEDNSEQ